MIPTGAIQGQGPVSTMVRFAVATGSRIGVQRTDLQPLSVILFHERAMPRADLHQTEHFFFSQPFRSLMEQGIGRGGQVGRIGTGAGLV